MSNVKYTHFLDDNQRSNNKQHSADNVQGFLNREVLKSFFSVSGPDNAHVWTAGHEKIPQNWYKRPSTNPYGAVAAVVCLTISSSLSSSLLLTLFQG